MLLFFKRLLMVAAVALMLARESKGFALLGAFNDWQVQAIGYDPDGDGGDLGGPKNLGEEYRWTTPAIFYAFDSSFIEYFGTNGIQAIRNAAQLFNTNMVGLGDLTDDQLAARFGYDRTRQRFNMPVGRRVNSTAMGLGLLDLKTYMMGLLTEQLGMASPERWVYALRDRTVINNVTNYLVVQRNFDPFTFQPSQYVNGARYHYVLREFDNDPDFADAVEIRVNQSDADPIPYAVANMQGEDIANFYNLRAGEFYETLTMDDVASLRYIYRRQNINQEDVIPGTSLVFTDPTAWIFLQGFDLYTFWSNASVLSPTQLRAIYTNLVIMSTNVTLTPVLTTNRVITNLFSDSSLFTNRQQLTLVSNMDYGRFLRDARTNPPATLRALYPGLIITSTNSSVETVLVENVILTNSPYGVPGEVGYAITNYVPTLQQTFQYTFGNVVVRYSSTVSDWLVQDIGRSPFGVPGEIFLTTNTVSTRVMQPSGGFFILNRAANPNLVGYDFTDGFGNALPKVTNIFEVTNIVRSLINPFTGDVNIRSITTRFTNVLEAAYEIVANAIIGQQEVDVVTRTFAPRFTYTFGTNFLQFPSLDQTVLNREFQGIDGLPFPPLVSRVPSPFPIGAGIILDPGTVMLDTNALVITPGLMTNTVLFFTNAANGSFLVREQVVVTNSLLVAANPVQIVPANGVAQRAGVDTLQLVEFPHRGNFLQQPDIIATNVFDGFTFTNGQRFAQQFRRVGGPDIVIAAGDPAVSANSLPIASFRNVNWSPTPAPNSPARPGVILPSTTITFSKLYPSDWNQFPGGWNTAIPITGWGSFDGTTKPPIVYPQDVTLQQLEAFVLGRNP